MNKSKIQPKTKSTPPTGVIGPSHFMLTFKMGCSERKNILKEKINVPAIKIHDIISFSSKGISDKMSKARPWYIIYLTPTSKDCNADSGSLFLSIWAPKAPKTTDIIANVIPKISKWFINSKNSNVLF